MALRRRTRFTVTAEVAAAITSSLDIDEVLANVARRAAEVLEVSECDIYGYQPGEETATCLALWARERTPDDDEWIGGRVLLASQPTFAQVLREGRMMAAYLDAPALPDEDRERMETWGEEASLFVPMVFGDRVIGCLQLIEKRRRRVFGARERELASTLATLAAVAIEKARLHARLEEQVAFTELERQRLALILENTDDGVVLVDLQGSITFTNPTVRRLFEATGEQSAPTSLAELRELYEIRYADERAVAPDELMGQAFAGAAATDRELTFVHRHSAHQRTVLFSALPVRDAQGVVMQVVITIRDITERKRSEELLQKTLDALESSHQELLELAIHDPLTGLLNRRRFEEEFEGRLAEQERLGRGGALIWLDLDHFKDVNDTLGHRAGDELLVFVAGLMRKEMRRYSVIARLGGDEFAVLIPGADKTEALAAASRLIDVFSSHEAVVAEHVVQVGMSVGVALYPDHGSTTKELLAAADVAMYHAKESGRGRVSLYEPEQPWTTESVSRTLWGERIRAALAEDRLVLFAQPIRSLSSKPSAEFELLVRMMGDDDELIAPLEFIPSAERLGLIGEIDRWVVRQAIRLLAAEEAAGEPTRLAVNLSGRTLSDASILDVFREEFASTGADPARLTIEVTETAVVSNLAEATSLVRELHRLGCRFSMDDFGTGTSSFYYLRHLPVDELKIDGSLIKGLGVEASDEQFVGAIVQMCDALQISCVAEFVESNAMLAEVRQAGVDYAQGFSVGRPGPLGAYLKSQGGSGLPSPITGLSTSPRIGRSRESRSDPAA